MADPSREVGSVLLARKDPFSGDKREDGLHGMTAMMRLTRVRHGAHEGGEPSGPDLPRASAALRASLLAIVIEEVDALGLTHHETAERIGTTPETLERLLRGQIERFDLDTLVEILARLDRRVDVAVVRRGQGNA